MGGAHMRHAYCTALDRGKMVSRLSSLLPLPPGCSAGMIMARSALPRLGIQTSRYIRHKTLLSSPKSRLFSSSPSLWLSAAESREGANAASDGSPRRPKAVIFDLGGVVVPSPLPIFSRFEERHGLTQGSVVKTITQTGADGSFAGLERGELTVEQFSEPFSREFRSIFGIETPSGIFKELLEDLNLNITAVSEVLEMISDLRKNGVKTALLTNNFRYDDGRTLFPNEELGVDVVVESCLEGTRKPESSIYLATLERLGVEPAEAVFLDDIGINLKAAKQLGIHTILVEDISVALAQLEGMMKLGSPNTAGLGGHVPGTSEVSEKLLFPVEGLVTYLQNTHGLHQDGPPLIRQFKHGQSNPTYYIEYGGAQLVLRKKPPGKLLPSAHAVEREYRVMRATQKAGVPIPALLSLCEDESVIGTPFYVMRYVSGQVLKDPALPGLQPQQRRVIYSEMVRVLGAIHRVNVEEAELSDFGKHGSYLTRQIARWSKQYSASETHSIPTMDSLMQWLSTVSPRHDKTTVVHGDFRLDNLIYSAAGDEVLAVLDWELSTLGDPVSDLAYTCMQFHMDPGQPHLKGLLGLDLAGLGIPTEDELIQQYCRHTGTSDITDWSFYLAFTFFRVAAILQGVYKRSLQNQASADNAKTVGLMAEDFAKKGWHFAQRQQRQAVGGVGSGTTHTPSGTRHYSTLSTTEIFPHLRRAAGRGRSHSGGTTGDNSLMALMTGDVASFPPRLQKMREEVVEFMTERVLPREREVLDHQLSADRWTPLPLIDKLKSEAHSRGLWNLFLPLESDPDTRYGAGLSNLEYAHLAEIMGQSIFASEVFNCSAPDTGNMEVMVKYGTPEQNEEWLTLLLAGKIRSCFAMTEPSVASSDATNIQSSIVRQRDNYILNGRKWWISGAMDPRCKICIFMGKTDPQAPTHKQQSMILVPMDTPGVRVLRPLTVFQYDDAPSGHAEIEFSDVRVPAGNLLLGEGRGFEIAQGRLGPGRIHHCMRMIGMAERALGLMTTRVQERVAFGKPLAEQGTILSDIAQSRIEIEQARLLTLKAAHQMDTVGNKAARKDIAMIKVVAPLMAQRVVDRAMQAHGAMGLSGDSPLAQFFSWARILRLADGPDEVHTAALGRMELKRARDMIR